MNLSFEVNNGLLFSSLLFSNKSEAKSLCIPLKNNLWERYKLPYNHFLKGNDYRNIFFNTDNNLNELLIQTKQMLKEGIKIQEFKKLLSDTEEYKKWLENEWSNKKEIIINILEDILRIKLPSNKVTVYVIDPRVGGGSYLGNNKIFWGHKEDWSNYNVVYLAHEFLHTFIPSGEIEHCIIELATDNELRIRLNGEGEYFIEGEKKVGHGYLKDKENYLLPFWKEYLINPDKDIYKFIEYLKQKDHKDI